MTKLNFLYSWYFFNLNTHTDFYKDRLKEFEDNSYFVKNTKW